VQQPTFMSAPTLNAPQLTLVPPETTPPRYSLVHVFAMPITFVLVLVLMRLAAG
jgi:hypothetical protein